MQKPPKFSPVKPSAKSFRSLRDGNRYDAAWQRIAKAMLSQFPVCHCDAVRTWQGGREVLVAFSSVGTRQPAQHVDHVRPLNMGGTHAAANLQCLCQSCHSRKTSRFG